MCVVRGVEVRGRSEVCGRGGVDVGSGSMSVLLYCIGVCTCALCVCCVCVVCVCTTVKMAIHLQCLACATLQGVYSLEGGLPCEYVCCCTSVTADGTEWVGLGGAVVPAPRRLPLLLELPRGG